MFHLPYYFVKEKKVESGTIITVTEHGIASMFCNRNLSSEAAPESDNKHVVIDQRNAFQGLQFR